MITVIKDSKNKSLTSHISRQQQLRNRETYPNIKGSHQAPFIFMEGPPSGVQRFSAWHSTAQAHPKPPLKALNLVPQGFFDARNPEAL